ncbi:MAG: energy transducer TonB [Pseudomonadales bacterium]|jgi:TonB family protein|nr:energy transducer TonB [Pseudomonadales bacterium]
MNTTRKLTLAVFLASSLFSALASAQMISGPTVQAAGEGLIKPDANPLNPANRYLLVVPRDQRPPIAREALVNVLVDIDASGKVKSVNVRNGFHDSAVDRLVEKAVKGMSFAPATQGGNPVAFQNLSLQVLLRQANPPGVSDAMRGDLVKLAETMQKQDYRGAERSIDTLLDRNAKRLFEMALLNDQKASVLMSVDRNPEALLLSRFATSSSPAVKPRAGAPAGAPAPAAADAPAAEVTFPDSFLSPELYVDALRKRIALSLVNNQTGEALQVYEMLKEAASAAGKAEVAETLAPQMQQINDLLASDQQVGSAIHLIGGEWSFTMSPRRTFEVSGLSDKGRLDGIDIACGSNPVRRMPVPEGAWKIPDSWGQCDLIFRGKDGSTFNLFEYLN